MNNGDCGEVRKMGFDLTTLSERVSEVEETASYSVALCEAVTAAVQNVVGVELSDECDKEACEAPKTLDARLKSANYVIMCQLKEINRQLERL